MKTESGGTESAIFTQSSALSSVFPALPQEVSQRRAKSAALA
jgi:hypothetical protein